MDDPSPWVVHFASLVPATGSVLDVACGGGRHTRFFLARGHHAVAVDRDVSGIEDLRTHPQLEIIEVDLEDGRPFPLLDRRFAAVVVTNYLHRPILDDLVSVVDADGAFIYETFGVGNERFGRPSCAEFLLRSQELLELVQGRLRVVAFEEIVVDVPKPATIQHIAAVR